MSKRYSGKSFKDASVRKKAKLSSKEKRKLKKEKQNKENVNKDKCDDAWAPCTFLRYCLFDMLIDCLVDVGFISEAKSF